MKIVLPFSIVVFALGLSGIAYAQTSPDVAATIPSTPTSRAEVKADAKAAEKSGTIQRGQADENLERDTTKSTASRPAVKAATKSAERSGELARGEASTNMDSQNSKTKSTYTKAQRKADARTAEKNHEIPRGESEVNN